MKVLNSIPDCSQCKNVKGGESIFSNCPIKELENSFPHKRSLLFKKGEHLYKVNGLVKGLYCIYSGKARIYISDRSNKEETLYSLGAGEMIAFNGIEMRWGRINSAIAEEDTKVCFITSSDLNEVLHMLLYHKHGSSTKIKTNELPIPLCSKCKNSIFCTKSNPLHKIGDALQSRVVELIKKGDFLYHSGEKVNGIFCIYSGEVKLTRPLISDQEITIHCAGDGEIIGLNSIQEGWHKYSAMAIEDTQACFIPLKDILQLMESMSIESQKCFNSKY